MATALRSVVILFGFFPLSSTVKHSLMYFDTATLGISNVPEFFDTRVVDGIMVSHYESQTQKMSAKQDWIMTDDHDWDVETKQAQETEKYLKAQIQNVKRHFNQTQAHVYQRMYGCEWDDEGSQTLTYEMYGYDGENFLHLNMDKMRWIADVEKAVPCRNERNKNWHEIENLKQFLTQDCTERLKKYVVCKNNMERKDTPKVSLFQNTHSSGGYQVVCHATGFYPEGVLITWKRDGMEMQDDVSVGETRPNEDGTFQRRAVISVSHEEWMKSQYTCEVTHTSVGTISKQLTLEEDLMLCNIAVIAVIALVTVIAVIIAIMWWKKKSYGFVGANTQDSSEKSTGKSKHRTNLQQEKITASIYVQSSTLFVPLRSSSAHL